MAAPRTLPKSTLMSRFEQDKIEMAITRLGDNPDFKAFVEMLVQIRETAVVDVSDLSDDVSDSLTNKRIGALNTINDIVSRIRNLSPQAFEK